ncbi:MAG: WbqC family protein [Candidatus Omnitrophica bacterium]|nr:WbqC family protein [Candidatus Omnitrophota bacterium]
MMVVSVHQPQYIPWLGYFDKIAHSDAFVFLDTVQYKAGEFQNRNKIRIKDGWMWLTVPVISKGKARQRICDVIIDNSVNWPRRHLRSLEIWYGSSPFFDNYYHFFKDTYSKRWERLSELCVHIINYILKELSINTPIYFESDLDIKKTGTERIIQICKALRADTYLSGIGGKAYLEEERFKEAKIRLVYQDFVHPVYHQRFCLSEEDFIPNMSILDLLFNEGANSRNILLRR